MQRLAVELVDFSFDAPATVDAGLVSLVAHNGGGMQHELVLGRLNDGVTWDQIESAAHGPVPDAVLGMLTAVGGVGVIDPEVTAQSIAKVEPGTYAMLCFIPAPDGVAHLGHGMVAKLEVTASTATTSDAPSGLRGAITLADMTITVPDGFDGSGRWTVTNAGPAAHQAMLMKLADGVTMDQVTTYLAAAPTSGESPPVSFVGGVNALSPGQSAWIDLDLVPGRYVWWCVIPDLAKGGVPHFVEGMLTPFEVS